MTDSGKNQVTLHDPAHLSVLEASFSQLKTELQKHVHFSRLGHWLLSGNLQGPKLTENKNDLLNSVADLSLFPAQT